ncbi:hypothetical protein FISHEDRAFT_77475 [Fistulina hepatica ATCC 64428]|uniref:Uncharacterized protein n=1 Tax=Fistulina hepatica ATCC 64428 TaxID=1128425 RepID=A0A0D7A1F8_9AGAR|nr:hypothetical protein FISHEDRAFT_77475 [Fistulina hepatica ATCC 64428]
MEPIHPVNLYTPLYDENAPTNPPTWRELASMHFSPSAMRDLQRRRELGSHDAPPDVKARLARADVMFFAQVDNTNRLYSTNHLYAEAIKMLGLPIGDPENLRSCFHLQDKYSDFLLDAILKLVELHDRLTNGMTMVTNLRPDSRLRVPEARDRELPPRYTVYVTPRFVNDAPHPLHMPLRACLDTFAHVFGPIVKTTYVKALANHEAGLAPVPVAHDGPSVWMPRSKPLSGCYDIPYPTHSPWQIVYLPDMVSFPEDALDSVIVPGIPGAAVVFEAQHLRRENQSLHVQLDRLSERTRIANNLPGFTLLEDRECLEEEILALSDSHDKLIQLMEDYVAAAIVPSIASATGLGSREVFERFTDPMYRKGRVMGGIGSWYVRRNEYDSLEQQLCRAKSRCNEMRHRLDEAKETSARYLERKEQALSRCRTYLFYAEHQMLFNEVREDLPEIQPSEWSATIGKRTFEYICLHDLEWVIPDVYAAIVSLPPSQWVPFIQHKMKDVAAPLVSNLLLLLGADLIHLKVGAYEATL